MAAGIRTSARMRWTVRKKRGKDRIRNRRTTPTPTRRLEPGYDYTARSAVGLTAFQVSFRYQEKWSVDSTASEESSDGHRSDEPRDIIGRGDRVRYKSRMKSMDSSQDSPCREATRTPVASSRVERDYVLGTHDAEIDRLASQHPVWREEVHRAWHAAGIGPSARVADVGCGPGFAAVDLARLVGPTGRVHAIDRSRRFLDALSSASQAAGHPWIETHEADLMLKPLPARDLDAVWCRWVACFVPDVRRLVASVAAALRPGGRLILHEYFAYSNYGLIPRRPEIAAFVEAGYESWRA